jgi:protocatechuate 3,4-dioxygenase beta subunit
MMACLAPALGMMLISGSAWSQPAAPGVIRGAVKDGSGSAVVGAVVNLDTDTATGRRTTITDETGSFHFSAVEPGTY